MFSIEFIVVSIIQIGNNFLIDKAFVPASDLSTILSLVVFVVDSTIVTHAGILAHSFPFKLTAAIAPSDRLNFWRTIWIVGIQRAFTEYCQVAQVFLTLVCIDCSASNIPRILGGL